MPSKTSKDFCLIRTIRVFIPLVLLYCFTPATLKAQCITNNEIELAALCVGNGLAVLKGSTPKGGNGSYTYTWEKNPKGNCANKDFVRIAGATGPDYIIPAGRDAASCYRRIVTSGNCKEESNKVNVKLDNIPPVSFTPTEPQASAQHPQSCSQATGSITVTPVSGMQYSINGTQYQQSNVFTNVPPGTYNVTVKNSAGCVSRATSVTINAASAAPAAPQASAQHPQSCSQATGSITVASVQGMQYSINGTQYQQSNVFNNVAPGTYNVTVKNSAGCVSKGTSVTVNASVATPAAPQASAQHPQACSQATGSITVTPVQGMQYSINGTQYQQSNVFNNVAPGTYNVTVKNSGGCVSQATSITVNAASAAPAAPQASVQHPQSCSQATGSITVTQVSGLQYSINGTQYQQSNVFNNVAPGTYNVTVKNSTGCVSGATPVTINSASAAPAAPQASAQHPQSCSQATGTITVTPVSGMQYSINGTQYQQSNVFNNVVPGTYNVTVKNSAGCISAASSVTVNPAGSAPTGTIIPASASICEGKSQVLTVSGGTSFQWKRNGAEIPGATSASYSATLDGTYTVTIKNGNCSGQSSNSAVVKVQACIPIGETKAFVPAAFTPDKNNTNDQLRPYFKNVTELKYFKVFNRWGQMIFQTNIIGEGWDGSLRGIPQPSETYSWVLEFVDSNGKLNRQSGTTVLVR